MSDTRDRSRRGWAWQFWVVPWLLLVVLTGTSTAAPRPRELLIGIEPEHNIFTQMENYRKLAGYLTAKGGIPVRLTIMSRYGEALQRFKALHLDGAFLNSYTAAMTIEALGMEPLVRPVNLAGETSSRGVILTRRDSGIQRFSDMRGRSFAFVDPATTEGYLFPLAYLRKNGITTPGLFLGHQLFTGSHASTISAVLDGRADLGAAKEEVYQRQIAKDPTIARELVVLERSEPVPPTTLCLSGDLDPALKRELAGILLAMDKEEAGREVLQAIGALRFTKAEKKDYDIVLQMEKAAGITRRSTKTE